MPRPTSPLATPLASSILPILLGTAVVLALVYWARPILIPVALAILITFLLAPLVTWLTRRGLGRVPSATLVTLSALALTVLVGWVIARQVGALLESYPQYERNINAKIASLRWVGKESTIERARNVARRMQRQLERADVEDTPEEAEVRKAQPVRMVVDPGPFRIAAFWSFAAPILAPLAAAALVIVLVFFMLMGREDLRDRFIALIGERQLAQTTSALDDAGSRISRFLMTQLAINAAFGAIVGIGLFILGVPFAPLWGAIAFVMRYIPYLGPWLAMLLPFSMALLVTSDWSTSLAVVALFGVVEGITNLLVEPMLYGRGIGVSQPALLVAVAFWTWLWGPVGLVLASPLTVCLVVLGRHAPNLKFLDTLLGDRPALEPHQRFYQRLLARDHDEAVEIAEAQHEQRPLIEVYEQLLLPALNAVRQDARLDRIEETGVQQLSETVREIAETLASRTSDPAATTADGAESPPARTRLLGIPSRDAADEAALSMMGALLGESEFDWMVATRAQATQEIVAMVQREAPDRIWIASVPPGGLMHARHLCTRLHARFPELPIAIGRWGLTEDVEREKTQLLAAGAERVDTTLFETIRFCALQVAPAAAPAGSTTPVATVAFPASEPT